MQEKTRPVFVVATSNDIDALPPELLRKGRFDAIFYVDLPNKIERKSIFDVHIKKALKTQKLDNSFDTSLLAERSKGFNGAEIEEVVNEAMFSAFAYSDTDSPNLGMKHLVDGIKSVEKSLIAKVMREKISFDRERAKSRFLMASSNEAEDIDIIFKPEKVKDIRTMQEAKSVSRDWILPDKQKDIPE